MGGTVGQLRERARVVAEVMRSRDLRRDLLAFGWYYAGDWALLVALGVYAYDEGGIAAVGLVRVMQMLPGALVVPFASLLADRFARERVLVWMNVGRCLAIGGGAAAAASGGSLGVIYAVAAADAVFAAGYRPAQWALVPLLTRTPRELVAANAASGTIEGSAVFLGPVAAGALIAVGSPALALAFCAAAFATAALLLLRVRTERVARAVGAKRAASEVLLGLRTLAGEPHQRVLVGLFTAQTLVRGMLNVLVVVAAIELLGLGRSGAGFLNSAYGAGALVGAALAIALVGSARLGRGFAVGLVVWGSPIALIGIWPEAAVAVIAVGVVGIGNALLNVSGFTLLQRLVPDEVLARVFGVMETLIMAAVALGAGVTPLLIEAFGLEATLIATGAILPLLAIVNLWRLRAVDDATVVPERELVILAGTDLFSPLPAPALERVARRLTRIGYRAGEEIVREGDVGDRFYLLASGSVEVSSNRETLSQLGPGSYFGEIALLREIPRTATVTAATDCEVFALDRDDFVATLTAHPRSGEAAAATVEARFAPQ